GVWSGQWSRGSEPSHVSVAPLAAVPTHVGHVPQHPGAASAQRSTNGMTRKNHSRRRRSTLLSLGQALVERGWLEDTCAARNPSPRAEPHPPEVYGVCGSTHRSTRRRVSMATGPSTG